MSGIIFASANNRVDLRCTNDQDRRRPKAVAAAVIKGKLKDAPE